MAGARTSKIELEFTDKALQAYAAATGYTETVPNPAHDVWPEFVPNPDKAAVKRDPGDRYISNPEPRPDPTMANPLTPLEHVRKTLAEQAMQIAMAWQDARDREATAAQRRADFQVSA